MPEPFAIGPSSPPGAVRLWHHDGRAIHIRPVQTDDVGPIEWAHFHCQQCDADWCDTEHRELRALEQLVECPFDLDRERNADLHSTLTPEEVLASGEWAIPLLEDERQALVALFLRSDAGAEAFTEWACDHVYRLDATWPDWQIERSLRIAADAISPGAPPEFLAPAHPSPGSGQAAQVGAPGFALSPGVQDLAAELVAAHGDQEAQGRIRERAQAAGVPWQAVSAMAYGIELDATGGCR